MFHRVPGRQLRSHLLLLHQGRWTPRAWGGSQLSCLGGVRGSWSHKVLSESFRGSRATGRSRGQMVVTACRGQEAGGRVTRATQGALAGGGGSVTVAGTQRHPSRAHGRWQRAASAGRRVSWLPPEDSPQHWGRFSGRRVSRREDQPPYPAGDRHTYWANRVLCLQSMLAMLEPLSPVFNPIIPNWPRAVTALWPGAAQLGSFRLRC